jgi:co-chaperonin GroES (HSP10)
MTENNIIPFPGPEVKKKDFELYGERVALLPVPEEYEGRIAVPDGHKSSKTHDLGQVAWIGDGMVDGKQRKMFVKTDEIVMFQMNAILGTNYVYKVKGKVVLIIQQSDLLARLTGKVIKLDTFEILGHWILARAFASTAISTIQIPDAHMKKDRFQVVQAGSEVTNCKKGDWIIPNMQFCNALEIGSQGDYFYLSDNYVYGIVEDSDPVTEDRPTAKSGLIVMP